MVRFALVLLLLAGCARQPSPDQVYQQAWTGLRAGQLDSAAKSVHELEPVWRKTPGSELFWKFQLLQAEILLAQGRAQQAIALLIPGSGTAPTPSLELRRRLDICDALSKLGRYSEASASLDEAGRMISPGTPPELSLQSETLRGVILARTAKYDLSRQVLRGALQHAIAQGNSYYQAAILVNLAFCELREFRFDAAAAYGEKAVAAGEAAGAKRLVAGASVNLGLSYARLGDFDRALELTRKAAAALEQINDRANLVESLGEIGNLNVLQGRYEESIASYKRAFNLATELNLPSSAATWATNIATELIETNHLPDAEQWNATATGLAARSGNQRVAPMLIANSADIQTAQKKYHSAIQTCSNGLQHAAEYPDVQWMFHAKLAALYGLTGRNPEANRHYEAALSLIEAKRAQLTRSDFQLSYLGSLLRFYQNYITALIAQGRPGKALEIAESSRARVLAGTLGPGQGASGNLVARYQALARETKTVFLSYWLGPQSSLLWMINGSGLEVFNLPAKDLIAKSISSYRRLIEESIQDPLTSGQAGGATLFSTLLGQAIQKIPKESHVVIIPDGPLHQLNFETLPVPGASPHYWIEDVTVAVAPSLNVIAANAAGRSQVPPSVLLIGDPAPEPPDFPALPNAHREIETIQLHFKGNEEKVYTGRSAVPAIYKQADPGRFALIHFAAHAEANRQSPLDSAVVLSRQGDGFKLYARDIVDVPLRADLVTVSACRGAGARSYEGEGLVGFAWAFLRAGARAVIAGLWDVSDSSTAMLMDHLYGRIAAGDSPVDALRNAKLALVHSQSNYRKPYYWAPFQAYIREIN